MTNLRKRYILLTLFIIALAFPLAWGVTFISDEEKEDTSISEQKKDEKRKEEANQEPKDRQGPPRRGQMNRDRPAPPFAPGHGMGMGRRGPQGPLHAPERINRLRKEFPELAEIIEQIHRVKAKLFEASIHYHHCDSEEEKAKEKKKIQDLLEKEYELEIQRQQAEIEYLERQIERVKELMKRFRKAKEKILELRFKQHTENMPIPEEEDSSTEKEEREEEKEDES